MCNCNGKVRRLVVSTDAASVQTTPRVSGMPRYVVTGSAKGDQTFATYNEARIWKAAHGGKLRAV